MDFSLAEIPDRPVPGVWFGSVRPCTLFASTDRERWDRMAGVTTTTPVGWVLDWPRVTVTGGQLESVRETDARRNLLCVCGELVSFRTAELVSQDTYLLGDLQRGLRGTSEAVHDEGHEVMLLTAAEFVPVHWRLVGVEAWWKAVPNGLELGDAPARPFQMSGLVFPRLDGSRPSVRGRVASPPSNPEWAARYIVERGEGLWLGQEGAVFAWVDAWVREPVEPGAVVYDVERGQRSVWDGRVWGEV